MVKMNKKLEKLYRDPKKVSSLGGIERLFKEAKKVIPGVKREDVVNFLQTQYAYTRHKSIRKKFPRRKTVAVDVNDMYQADLADMVKFSKFNDDYKYLLTCIDVFSKYGFAIPISSKKPEEIVRGLSIIFKEYGIPLKFQFDNGTEFKNATVKSLLRECGVIFYFTRNDDIKCALVERFNRTIKERLWKYMAQENNYRYIDVLKSVVSSYNNSVHSSTGFAPIRIGIEESRIIRHRMLLANSDFSVPKFAINDFVRIAKKKGTFEHGFEANFTDEIFVIIALVRSNEQTLYRIKDRSDQEVYGLFYEEELSKVVLEQNKGHRIEKILRSRKRNGQEEYLVHWSGFSSAHDSWINKDDTTR
jgi:hypothetical protein